MKKKGFTLVELLAVIAILAILVIIALPNVLGMFRQAKENTFVEEVQKLYQTAETTYINNAMSTTQTKCFSSVEGETNLDLTGRSLNYVVLFNDAGSITKMIVSDGSYMITAGEGTKELKITNIVSSANKGSDATKYAPTTISGDVKFSDTCAKLLAPAE